ncbi:Geranylgeranyl transferase type-2 subunit alpha [Takifugu flavidus]|uniref:Geranylgeranyl transferase type-2 subunit alpha n=1 Tax=Takifugu flavidus TaxID=433684 RepID=A0A5C6MW42_9TELE|nr:Geranylgeranyl transferase type-2 subunit alpha [Takifugu flavidus]
MHGRVKVKSTAQQEEEKRKEREKKLKLYITARDACFSKRKEGVLDDDALQLSQQLLSSNPDFATLWNYRREILMHMETVKNEDEMQKVYEAELSFLESCLKMNPKSYGSWHHRCWVSTRLPRPDWARELSLCDRCLSLDDRNFHCWDYRRMVVKMSGVPVDQELAFTDRLIGSNFSNYSSWHYRSTLLPLLHPESPDPPSPSGEPPRSSPPPSPQSHSHRVCEEQLLKEYELVRNAFFTDPNDQSAWFYYRWLLGRAEREEIISCVFVSREEERVAVAFSRPVNCNLQGVNRSLQGPPTEYDTRLPAGGTINKVMVWHRLSACCWYSTGSYRESSGEASTHVSNTALSGRFFYHSGTTLLMFYLWAALSKSLTPAQICDLPPGTISDIVNEHNLTVHWTEKHTHRDCALYTGRCESWCRDSATDQELFRSELSVEKTSVLQSELDSCNQLQELEPLNKWCLLTVILLMRALDPLGYEKETLAHFQTLKEVDPMRSAYYSDLCSKFMIENTILKMEYAEVRVFSIADKNLTTLCHLDQLLLVTHISLSSNQLEQLPPQFAMLQCLEVLEADNNKIEKLEGVYQLPKLEEVLLRNNKISTLADLQPLASCPKLKHLDLRGNPVTQTDNIEAELAELLPSVTHLLL